MPGYATSQAGGSAIETAMTQRLQAAFSPSRLRLENESALHAGHAGAREGGHFRLRITSTAFAGKTRVARHRMVYDALADLMRNGIHALAITALAPDEDTEP